jgi:hypothetical protein
MSLFSIKWRNKALILNEFCRQWLNFDLSFELLLILLQILILFSNGFPQLRETVIGMYYFLLTK